ncbi:phenylacetate--CoA ligase family protein, partial [Myroides ceti]|nr:phenylacetate--CoA ligase family protein [Paenimyroides ceti]
ISTNSIGTDEILIRIHTADASVAFLQKLKDAFRAKLRVTPQIQFELAEDLQKIIFNPVSRKPITFIDKRA